MNAALVTAPSRLTVPEAAVVREDAQVVVCRCLRVTAADLIEALETQPINTLQEVIHCTGAGDGCMACHRLIRQYLQQRGGSYPSSSSPGAICSCK
jgi:NAD(P)H-nitrite reductase large subunit